MALTYLNGSYKICIERADKKCVLRYTGNFSTRVVVYHLMKPCICVRVFFNYINFQRMWTALQPILFFVTMLQTRPWIVISVRCVFTQQLQHFSDMSCPVADLGIYIYTVYTNLAIIYLFFYLTRV